MSPERLRPWVLRIGLLATAVVVILFVRRYGLWTVPAGMDTMGDEFAPGAVCIIDRDVDRVRIGDVVLFALDDGSVLLSRAVRTSEEGFVVAHDSAESRYAALQGDALGVIPHPRARFRLLVSLHDPPADVPGTARGR